MQRSLPWQSLRIGSHSVPGTADLLDDLDEALAELGRLRRLCVDVSYDVDAIIDAHVCTGVDACTCSGMREATAARLRAAGGGS